MIEQYPNDLEQQIQPEIEKQLFQG